jgi:hypothetical protein
LCETLHQALKHGHDKCAKILLAHGINVNKKDDSGCTPLYEASVYGYNECIALVSILLDNGAKVNDKNNYGWTPHANAPHADASLTGNGFIGHQVMVIMNTSEFYWIMVQMLILKIIIDPSPSYINA